MAESREEWRVVWSDGMKSHVYSSTQYTLEQVRHIARPFATITGVIERRTITVGPWEKIDG